MNRDDGEYFRRRAREEDRAAEAASCEAARERHTELAELHRRRSGTPADRHAFQLLFNPAVASPPAAH